MTVRECFLRAAAALTAAASLFIAAGCANSQSGPAVSAASEAQTSSGETTTAEETKISDDLPDSDFDGYGFRIICAEFYSRQLAEFIVYKELTGNPVDDELYNAKTKIEDRFNVKISTIELADVTVLKTTVQKAVLAGEDAFDIQIGHDTNTVSLANSGCFYNMKNVAQFNFDKPWWPANTCKNLSVCGKMFVASNYMSYCGMHWTRAICINKDYAAEYGLTVPYEDVRAGTWTLDKMFTFIDKTTVDVDGNGKFDDSDKYGFATGGQTWYCMQEALNCGVYTKDASDVPQLSLDVDRLTEMTDKISWLVRDSQQYHKEGDFAVVTFSKGLVLLAYTQIGDAYDTYRQSEFSYGFLPTPKLDENQENYINCCTDVPWAIPVNTQHIDIIGTVCEALSCYNYNNVLPAYFEVAMKVRMADTADDAEMLQLIADTRTIGFAYAYGLKFNNVIADVVEGKKEIASYVAKNEASAQKGLTKLIDTINAIEN
jgi:hypothetical protein